MMSEGEYQYQMALCDSAGYDTREHQSLDVRVGCWRVRGGSILKIRKMSVAHLKNAIGYFERAGRGSHSKIQELRAELARR